MRPVILVAAALTALTVASDAQASGAETPTAEARPHIVALPEAIPWGPAPAALPPGARLAVIEGDPSAAAAFTMRLWMADGYTIPPHFHPADEHVTVLQGTFLVGMGDRFDAGALAELPTGAFGMLPTGMHHFARARGEVVIQLHGVGPWGLTYVNPADDPRYTGK